MLGQISVKIHHPQWHPQRRLWYQIHWQTSKTIDHQIWSHPLNVDCYFGEDTSVDKGGGPVVVDPNDAGDDDFLEGLGRATSKSPGTSSNQAPIAVGGVAVLVKMAKSRSPARQSLQYSLTTRECFLFTRQILCIISWGGWFIQTEVNLKTLSNLFVRMNQASYVLLCLLPRCDSQWCKLFQSFTAGFVETGECELPNRCAAFIVSFIFEYCDPDWVAAITNYSWFLYSNRRSNVRDAVVGLLDLMVKDILHCLAIDAGNPSSQKCASALLKMATEVDDSVRLGIANAGLDILVRFVRNHGTGKLKELLTTSLGLNCKSGNGCEVHFPPVKIMSFLRLMCKYRGTNILWQRLSCMLG